MIITNQCEPQRLKVLKRKNGGYRGLIYTVTLNPAIDYIVRLDHVETGAVNRMASEDKFAGGKGINVSRVLKRLDIENTATGFIGGFTGRFIEDVLTSEAISTNFVTVDQDTRINVKIKADEETEINGNGPEVTEAQLQELLNILSSLTADDVVVFAGSAPSSLGNAIYKQLIAATRATGAQVVCDFEGQTLIDSLEFNPQLVKPNNHELGDIFGVTLTELPEIERYAKEILAKGAQNVIISMAGDGALLVSPSGTYFAKPIKGSSEELCRGWRFHGSWLHWEARNDGRRHRSLQMGRGLWNSDHLLR